MTKRSYLNRMEKKRILCFGDSLTWGYNPETKTRFSEDQRWTGILADKLGDGFVVIEEGQNGRTIATDDPAEGEKNGIKYIIPCIESQSPVDLLILMLGSNDLKRKYSYASIDIAGEMQLFLEKVIAYNHFRMEDRMEILLVSPPLIGENIRNSWLGDCFDYERSYEVSRELSEWYSKLAHIYHCRFMDAAEYAVVSPVDSAHLDTENHRKLAEAFYQKLKEEIYPESFPA